MPKIARVIFPLSIQGLLSYLIPAGFPQDWTPRQYKGQWVSAPIGKKQYWGVVHSVVDSADPSERTAADGDITLRELTALHPVVPPLSPVQLQMLDFLSEYYLCTPGQALGAFHPKALLKHYGSLKEDFVSLADGYDTPRLQALLDSLKNAPRQIEIVETLIENRGQALASKELVQDSPKLREALRRCLKKGMVKIEQDFNPRIKLREPDFEACPGLLDEASACRLHTEDKPCLLHSSDPLPYFLSALRQNYIRKRSSLLLVPHPSHIEKYRDVLKKIFRDRLLVLGPSTTERYRAEISYKLRQNRSWVVLGLRPALFFPYSDLGLIIIADEEDSLYKQNDTAPRYHGRDTALYAARLYRAEVILQSACPSLESLYNASTGLFTAKAAQKPWPVLQTGHLQYIDLSREVKPPASLQPAPGRVLAGMEHALRNKKEVRLLCPSQDSIDRFLRPWFKVHWDKECLSYLHIDTYNRAAYEITAETALVVCLQNDRLLERNGFRSVEKAGQLMARCLSPMSGLNRCIVLGEKLSHPFYAALKQQLPPSFFETQIAERQQFFYPPFCRLVGLGFKHKTESKAREFAGEFCERLRQQLREAAVLGPYKTESGPAEGHYFIYRALIKLPKNHYLGTYKALIAQALSQFQKQNPSCRLVPNVDPV